MSTTCAQTSGSEKQPPHDLVTVTAKAPEGGYAFVFVSNEHHKLVDVYFDDATFSHTPGPIVSSSDYYPFGLAFNSHTRSTTPLQNYSYNGKELQDELSLGWLDYGARMYNAEAGRWFGLDPLADISRRWSPYTYALDNPMRFIDPDGMSAEDNQQAHRDWLAGREERSARRRGGSGGMGVAENAAFKHDNNKGAKSEDMTASSTGSVSEKAEPHDDETDQQEPVYAEMDLAFYKVGVDYMGAGNVGMRATFILDGGASVRNENGTYYLSVAAKGFTSAATEGDLSFVGRAMMTIDGKPSGASAFSSTMYREPSLQPNRNDGKKLLPSYSGVGYIKMKLPATGFVKVTLEFSYQINFGSAGNSNSRIYRMTIPIRPVGYPRK